MHSAGLAQQLHRSPAGRDRAGERLRERGLAGAVEPLDRYQPAAGHHATVPSVRMALVTVADPTAALPGIEAHPHARAVLAPGLPPQGDPSHAYLFHGPSGNGKAGDRARVRRRPARRRARTIRRRVAERIARGSHPDLTWVTPSGAAEMLVGDIEEPVVAAATRTPFESSRRVFVIEAVHAMNDQAANRLLKTLEEPPAFVHLLLLTDRREDVLQTVASRCQHVRFDPLPPARMAERLEGSEPAQARACAGLALGDAGVAARLASEEGRALRRSAEDLVRSALAGTTGARPWIGLLGVARTAGTAAGEQAQERIGARAGAPAEQRAEALRTGRARGKAPGRATRAHANAGPRAATGGAVAARRAVHLRRSPGARLRR